MNKAAKILVVEDDVQLTFFVRSILERENYAVSVLNKGETTLDELRKSSYDLVLLDVELPDADGVDVCEKIKGISNIPVILFTAKDKVNDKVKGLDAGANDYITKPVEVPELLARVRSHLRNRLKSIPAEEQNFFSFKKLTLSTITREVTREDIKIKLSPKEFEILLFFLKNPNKTITKEELFKEIWHSNIIGLSDCKVIDEHINKLRKKIHNNQEPLIHTIYGIGYILK